MCMRIGSDAGRNFLSTRDPEPSRAGDSDRAVQNDPQAASSRDGPTLAVQILQQIFRNSGERR